MANWCWFYWVSISKHNGQKFWLALLILLFCKTMIAFRLTKISAMYHNDSRWSTQFEISPIMFQYGWFSRQDRSEEREKRPESEFNFFAQCFILIIKSTRIIILIVLDLIVLLRSNYLPEIKISSYITTFIDLSENTTK